MTRPVYTALVAHEDEFWIITVPEIQCVTQAMSHDDVERMARDLIATWQDVEPDSFDLNVRYR